MSVRLPFPLRQEELAEFYKLVAVLEGQLAIAPAPSVADVAIAGGGAAPALTLRRLLVRCQE